ncbi:MAG: hypothetical protein HY877_00915 [Deltaproteobacteria bacterium]|nr:hypothetical protein [Deltaproteobacteria bacterium]
MSALKKFKTFEEATQQSLKDCYSQPLDKEKASVFLEELSRLTSPPYKPGVYRFRTFEEADAYDLEQYIRYAAEKANSC